jgi:hypothetical protein
MPVCSLYPTVGTKLGLKLVSTTPDGRMNSPAPPPFFVAPFGTLRCDRKPIVRLAPGARGSSGVNTINLSRSSGSYGAPFIVQCSSSQEAPRVKAICRIGISSRLTRSK